MVVVAHIEIWNDAEHPLFLLSPYLIFRHFGPCGDDMYFSDSRSKSHRDLRDSVILPRPQDCDRCLHREARRRDGELEGPGSDVGKGELTIVVREYLLIWGLIFP